MNIDVLELPDFPSSDGPTLQQVKIEGYLLDFLQRNDTISYSSCHYTKDRVEDRYLYRVAEKMFLTRMLERIGRDLVKTARCVPPSTSFATFRKAYAIARENLPQDIYDILLNASAPLTLQEITNGLGYSTGGIWTRRHYLPRYVYSFVARFLRQSVIFSKSDIDPRVASVYSTQSML